MIPFIFALLRAVTTGTDFRFVWIALASTIAAAIVLVVANRAGKKRAFQVILALAVATAAAARAGFAQGAQSATSVVIVALGFATCSVGGLSLLRKAS